MLKTHSLDIPSLKELHKSRQIAACVFGYRETQTNVLPDPREILKSIESPVKRTFNPAEPVVNLPRNALQPNPNIVKFQLRHAFSGLTVYQRSIGQEQDSQPQLTCVGYYLEEIPPDHRLAPGTQHCFHAKIPQIVQNAPAFGGRQLAGIALALRIGVAAYAVEIARAGQIPDHSRTSTRCAWPQGRASESRRIELRYSAPVSQRGVFLYQSAVEDADI